MEDGPVRQTFGSSGTVASVKPREENCKGASASSDSSQVICTKPTMAQCDGGTVRQQGTHKHMWILEFPPPALHAHQGTRDKGRKTRAGNIPHTCHVNWAVHGQRLTRNTRVLCRPRHGHHGVEPWPTHAGAGRRRPIPERDQVVAYVRAVAARAGAHGLTVGPIGAQITNFEATPSRN